MLSDLNDRIDSTLNFVEIGLVFSVPTVRYKIEKHFKLDAKKGTRERIDEESIKKRKVNEQA